MQNRSPFGGKPLGTLGNSGKLGRQCDRVYSIGTNWRLVRFDVWKRPCWRDNRRTACKFSHRPDRVSICSPTPNEAPMHGLLPPEEVVVVIATRNKGLARQSRLL